MTPPRLVHDLARLRERPLPPLALQLGYQPDPADPKRWKRHDSVISINGGQFFDHRTGTGGYGAIDLVVHACSCSCQEALQFLAHPTDNRPESARPRPDFVLPQARTDYWPEVQDYLTSRRALPQPLIARCHQLGLIFADSHGNALFLATETQRRPVGAELVGTRLRADGSRFRGLARGSRKPRGSFWLPVDRSSPHTVCLTESAIDTLSAWCLLPQWRTPGTVFVSTAGTAHRLPKWLRRWNLQRILCAFDADDSGDQCAERLLHDYPHAQRLRPQGAKDWNDLLQLRKPRTGIGDRCGKA